MRPVFHQKEDRIEAHIFIAFLAYGLHVTLGRRLHAFAPALTARAVLENFAAISMVDVHLPTTDGTTLQLTRYTQPDPETALLLEKLRLTLPPPAPPTISRAGDGVTGGRPRCREPKTRRRCRATFGPKRTGLQKRPGLDGAELRKSGSLREEPWRFGS